MDDFKFIQNPVSKKWIISAPRRAARPDEAKGTEGVCPFCPESQKNEPELFQLGEVRVLTNKFPFAPTHEVIIHSLDHRKNFEELEQTKAEDIFKTYRQRFLAHKDKGQVYIFHNRGEAGGESLSHPHSQLVVIPNDIVLEIEPPKTIYHNTIETIQTSNLWIYCPDSSEWPDEVWMSPKSADKIFGEVTDEEIKDLSESLSKLIKILKKKHGNNLSYNFYIYPGRNWYLRLMPRTKSLGGFELGTKVFINIQDPKETAKFLRGNS